MKRRFDSMKLCWTTSAEGGMMGAYLEDSARLQIYDKSANEWQIAGCTIGRGCKKFRATGKTSESHHPKPSLHDTRALVITQTGPHGLMVEHLNNCKADFPAALKLGRFE